MLSSATWRRAALALVAATIILAEAHNAGAQQTQRSRQSPAIPAKPPSYEPYCADIKMVFDVAKFNGEYKKRAYAWINGGCKGEVPLPVRGDRHNIGWFNTVSGILQTGGGIPIGPE